MEYENNIQIYLPNYLISRYEVKKALLDGQPVFFLYLKTDLEQITAVKKHIWQMKKIESIPVVLVMKQMTFLPKREPYQRKNSVYSRK